MKSIFSCFALALIASACTRERPGLGVIPDASVVGIDRFAVPIDTGTQRDVTPEAPIAVNPCDPPCGPVEVCGNNVDDDCNGEAEDGCACMAGLRQPCFNGPRDRRNIGTCADGVMQCGEFERWGNCQGARLPEAERCDGADNDCNGTADDGIAGCVTTLQCPATASAPPLQNYMLQGSRILNQGTAWQWTVECPSTVSSELCPAPANATAQDTQVYFSQSGAYRITGRFMDESGAPQSCAWSVYVVGTGLRVELDWDTLTRGVDLDLHMHRWTRNGADTAWASGDDCYYANCTPSGSISWGAHDPTPIENCGDAPRGVGAAWRTAGRGCRNPRLDVDVNGGVDCNPRVTDQNNREFCSPENINVDEPILGMPYRIMVNYYSGSLVSNPRVNVYCGGALKASFGADPDFVTMRSAGENWRVADVVFTRGACGIDCQVYPVRETTRTGSNFGGPWKCDFDPVMGICTPL